MPRLRIRSEFGIIQYPFPVWYSGSIIDRQSSAWLDVAGRLGDDILVPSVESQLALSVITGRGRRLVNLRTFRSFRAIVRPDAIGIFPAQLHNQRCIFRGRGCGRLGPLAANPIL